MQRATMAAIIRATTWVCSVAITITAANLLVASNDRNSIFWLTLSTVVIIETLWATYPVVRVKRTLLPLPLATIFVLIAYTVLVITLATVAYATPVSFNTLLTLHLIGALVVLVIPLGIVMLGGLFMSQVNEQNSQTREQHLRYRNRFRLFTTKLDDTQTPELEEARQLARQLNQNLQFSITESVPATQILDHELNQTLTNCETNMEAYSTQTESETTNSRTKVANAIVSNLNKIKQTLEEREIVTRQNKQ